MQVNGPTVADSYSSNEVNIDVKIFKGHKGEINSCIFSPDNQLLVTASDDSTLIVWNVPRKRKVCELRGHDGPVNHCVFSSDSRLLASASFDRTVKLWDTISCDCVLTLRGHSKSVESVCFSHSGDMLCSSSWDKTLIVWSCTTGEILYRLHGHTDCVKACCFSCKDDFIASGSWDYTVRVWRLNPSDKYSSDQARWILSNYKKLPDCDVYCCLLSGHSGNVQVVAFSTVDLLASGSWDRSIILWNPVRGQMLKKFLGHTGWVKSLSFSPNSLELISNAEDDSVRVWNVLSSDCTELSECTTEGAQSCTFSTEGKLLASGSMVIGVNK